jgi:hypothetical protein
MDSKAGSIQQGIGVQIAQEYFCWKFITESLIVTAHVRGKHAL